MKKSLKVNTTRVVSEQFTNFINVSHLLLVKPSDLMNDTPVFPSSYKMKWFFDALCFKSVFLDGLLWVFSWFYCCGWLVCLIKWRCDMSKYHKPSGKRLLLVLEVSLGRIRQSKNWRLWKLLSSFKPQLTLVVLEVSLSGRLFIVVFIYQLSSE